MDKSRYVANLSYKYQGDWQKIAKAIKANEEVKDHDIQEAYLTIFDEGYPLAFRKLRYPPWVIFYQGDLKLLDKPKVSIVGSRIIDAYAYEMTISVANYLAQDHGLVSGLAMGVDALVHQVGLEKSFTIGIIGSGMDHCYPASNAFLYARMRQNGLIISEYPHDVKVAKHHFPWRNRLIAALGERLYVTAAKVKSGTMHTVNEALELGKEIYCVPYALDNELGEGCNLLLFQGANIIIREELGAFFTCKFK
ncbi:MAG: DNA-protecting protein DprA [Erysipelotrichaceae bacterium]|nr:DNA-protecting protein DprA [Erysipelotrichaceae bacterium]MDY5252696.1 DNA-processing protein DprA [Erysipelotrichaceae bacterium]